MKTGFALEALDVFLDPLDAHAGIWFGLEKGMRP